MKARVHVFYKDSVFDPQGNTLALSLRKRAEEAGVDADVRVVHVAIDDVVRHVAIFLFTNFVRQSAERFGVGSAK